jgi:hypothetical protein
MGSPQWLDFLSKEQARCHAPAGRGGFVQIAVDARQRQILHVIRAAVDLGEEVLDMEHGQR